MKTKEELDAIKEEVEAVNEKLAELTEEEIAQVNGGVVPQHGAIRQSRAFGPVARQLGNMDDACYVQMHPTCIPYHGEVNIN